jgi:hypothetical protein
VKLRMRFALCIFAAGAFSAAQANDLVVNGGFETGDFTGWTTPASPAGDPFWMAVTNTSPNSGVYGAHIGAYPDIGTISQTIATTPGAQYILTFSYGEYNANDPLAPTEYLNPANSGGNSDPNSPYYMTDSLNVLWDGTSVFSDANFFTTNNPGPNNIDGGTSAGDYFYETVTATVTATGDFTTLELGALDFQQDVIVDDVSLVAGAPEPGTLVLLGSALLGLGLARRKRSRPAVPGRDV